MGHLARTGCCSSARSQAAIPLDGPRLDRAAERWRRQVIRRRLHLDHPRIVGVLGGLLGCAAGALLSRIIGLSVFGSTVSFNPIVIPVNVVISVLIALAGSLMPSRLIAKLHPAEVLHGRR